MFAFDLFSGMIVEDFDFFLANVDPDFGCFANNGVCAIITRYGYIWGENINSRRKSMKFDFETIPVASDWTLGLDFTPTADDIVFLKKEAKYRRNHREINLQPFSWDLSKYFIKRDVIDPSSSLSEQMDKLCIFNDCFTITGDKVVLQKPSLAFYPEMINTIMRDQSFNPNDLITDANERTVHGWRKTIKWTNKNGQVFELTTGEGKMFDEEEE